MGRRLYVGNLPHKTTDEDLNALFSQAGAVDNVRVMRDMATGWARGFAFVEMANDDGAQKSHHRSSTAIRFEGTAARRERGQAEARRRRLLLSRGGGGHDGGGRREPRW